ncbi:FkbM family methyltransferase [Pseudomonas sp. WPR_5_2]|uniref:FkbM family methyltransferase n=1 Tax=Pseudomonas sp. WPR_5_2 TaxID=1907371 RepID=UPI000EB5B47B|nr:FkbM family methyltransferase [Pseudomonas sp. WPR_5_2]RKS23975.1 FkbM family methyltransferase [Pseudomonas sp. WPR_5_2]
MHKFYGQFEPQVDKFIFERYFKDEGIKGVFVECGAFDGLTENSCKFFEETMGWKGYNVEPVPWVYENLCKNRPESTNLNFALSDKIGTATFTAVDHPDFGVDCTNGSLAHTEKHFSILEQSGCKFVHVEVDLLTWPEFIRRNNISHVDLLVLDVEGHELSVIDGMYGCEILPDVFCIEIGHLDFIEIRRKLSDLGYIYDISSHVNAFFIRKESISLFSFRAAHFESAPVQVMREVVNAPVVESQDAVLQNSINADLTLENHKLRKEIEVLTEHLGKVSSLYNDVVSSKGWRLIEAVRKIKS